MEEVKVQSQVAEPQPSVALAGEQVVSQPPTPTVETQPGAATEETPTLAAKPQEVPKPVTEQEVRDREAKILSQKDREIQNYRAMIAQQRLAQEIAQIEAAERQAQARDKADVEQGLITEEDGQGRQRMRMEHLKLRAEVEKAQSDLRQLRQQGEAIGRVVMAYEMAGKYGISVEALLKDQSLTDPLLMTQKILELALKQRDKELREAKGKVETFDKGPTTAAGGTLGDDAFLEAYSAGKSEDHKRAQKLLFGG